MTKAVADRSAQSARMVEEGQAGRALMRGTRGMREAGRRFLPQFPSEGEEAYTARRDASFLFNAFRKTVKDMAGRVFDKPVEIATGPAALLEWAQNIDLEGQDLSAFARHVFEGALAGPGIGYIMVDAPPREATVTQAQAANEGLRPYFVHLRAEDLLGWRSETVGGRMVLTQLRIMEHVQEPDPSDEFASIKAEQVRVLDRTEAGVQTRLFRQVERKGWKLVGEPTFSDMDEITVVPVYLSRKAFFEGEAPLEDLADLNVAHWQSSSDQRNILHFARVPLLHASGRDPDEGALQISAGTATVSQNPAARLEWVEHSGAAIGAGRDDLKDLEFQMQAHGLQLLVARQETATGAALDAAKETSVLAMMADALQDALEQALIYMAEYGGLDAGEISVAVNKDFGVSQMGAQEMQAMLMAVNTGNMSRETFLREMARRGMVSGDLDPLDEAERIEAEGGGLTNGGQ